MSDITTEYRGYRLFYFGEDKWGVLTTDVPIPNGTLDEMKERIDRWIVDSRTKDGIRVWHIWHDNPKYWQKITAVFREAPDRYSGKATSSVLTNNGSNPDNLYRLEFRNAAPDTQDAAEAIERAKVAFAEAVEAQQRWKEARAAIPRITHADVESLPERESR